MEAKIQSGITVTMSLSKTTPGTYVYMEDMSKPRGERVFPTIYVQKGVMTEPAPEQIEVTIRAK